MDSLRKQIGLQRSEVKKADSQGLDDTPKAPEEAVTFCSKPISSGALMSRQVDQFGMQRNASESEARKATSDRTTRTTEDSTRGSLPDYAIIADSDADSDWDGDMHQRKFHDGIDADYDGVNVWLHPIHGLPRDSSVRACPVKIAEGESLSHFGSGLLQEPLTTMGMRCLFEDGSLKAMDCSRRVDVPLLHATIVGAMDLPCNCNFTAVRVIEATSGDEKHELKGWLVICNAKDRFPLFDNFSRCGCIRQDFTDQYTLQVDLTLGAGGSGEVYAAKVVKTSQFLAAKLLKGTCKDWKIAREIKFLAVTGRHKNTVKFLGAFDSVSSNMEAQRCCLLFECDQQGDLLHPAYH